MGAEGCGPGKPGGVMRSMTPPGNGDRRDGRGMRLAGRLRESQGMAAQQVMSCAQRCRRHDSPK